MTDTSPTSTSNTGDAKPTVTAVPSLALHDLCKIMPPHTEREFMELVEDIANNKLQVPITTYEGKILDGRGRYNACVELAKQGIETGFRTTPYTGPDPRRYVVSINVKRRHLNESQRALIAAQLATYTHGGERGKASTDALTQKQAAELLNVSEPSVERASKVIKNGLPALVEAVKAGKVRVSAAENFAKSDQQDKLIAECEGDIVAAVKKLPKPPTPAKPMTPDEDRKARKQAVDDLKYAWSEEFNDWQRRYFVKTFKDEIAAILKEIEEWQGVIDEGQAAATTTEAEATQTTDAPATATEQPQPPNRATGSGGLRRDLSGVTS
jgi:hypothetical protein